MSPKESALVSEMENAAFSPGTVDVSIRILSGCKAAIDDMLLYLVDFNPSEDMFVSHLAEVAETYGLLK